MATVRLVGVRETAARMVAIPGRMAQRRPVRVALRAAGEVIREGAAQRAAVDTGLMRRSISVRQGVSRKLWESVHVGVTRRAFYWKFVEFGTSRMAAQPFMRPAFEGEQQAALRAFEREFPAAVDDAIRSIG